MVMEEQDAAIANGAENGEEQLAREESEDLLPDNSPLPEGSPMPDDFEASGPALEDEGGVEEHLKDAVEGSFRLKRMLTIDEENSEMPEAKRLKSEEENPKLKKLWMMWGVASDLVCKHVMSGVPEEELDQLLVEPAYFHELIRKSGTIIPTTNHQKGAGELIFKKLGELRERKMPGGGCHDTIAAFRFKWKLPVDTDRKLRALNHKDLRYVFRHYDGTKSFDEVIKSAADEAPENEALTIGSVPIENGVTAMSRWNRLELIDPLADSAVFGDANLTFSVNLAKHRTALGHVGRVIATTFEDLPTLKERYHEIEKVIKKLEADNAEVFHSVDCTRIAIDPKFHGMENTLGAVYYNFPHSGSVGGFFDSHPMVNWRHENLMRLFFRALRSFVKPGGWVKVSSNMNAVGVRYSYIIGSALENEFVHTETMPFLEWHLHRYGRSYGDKRDTHRRPDAEKNQSYNAQRAEADMVYCFHYQPSGSKVPPQTVRLPPTKSVLLSCIDGPFMNLNGDGKKRKALELHHRFTLEVSGTHVC
jgi:hypothetical protein